MLHHPESSIFYKGASLAAVFTLVFQAACGSVDSTVDPTKVPTKAPEGETGDFEIDPVFGEVDKNFWNNIALVTEPEKALALKDTNEYDKFLQEIADQHQVNKQATLNTKGDEGVLSVSIGRNDGSQTLYYQIIEKDEAGLWEDSSNPFSQLDIKESQYGEFGLDNDGEIELRRRHESGDVIEKFTVTGEDALNEIPIGESLSEPTPTVEPTETPIFIKDLPGDVKQYNDGFFRIDENGERVFVAKNMVNEQTMIAYETDGQLAEIVNVNTGETYVLNNGYFQNGPYVMYWNKESERISSVSIPRDLEKYGATVTLSSEGEVKLNILDRPFGIWVNGEFEIIEQSWAAPQQEKDSFMLSGTNTTPELFDSGATYGAYFEAVPTAGYFSSEDVRLRLAQGRREISVDAFAIDILQDDGSVEMVVMEKEDSSDKVDVVKAAKVFYMLHKTPFPLRGILAIFTPKSPTQENELCDLYGGSEDISEQSRQVLDKCKRTPPELWAENGAGFLRAVSEMIERKGYPIGADMTGWETTDDPTKLLGRDDGYTFIFSDY